MAGSITTRGHVRWRRSQAGVGRWSEGQHGRFIPVAGATRFGEAVASSHLLLLEELVLVLVLVLVD